MQSTHSFDLCLFSYRSPGCTTTEELFWKMDALQTFIEDLHWPDDVFANHLEQRLKLMACDLLELLLNRTLHSFQTFEKKGTRFGNATDYIIPSEMCVMVNIVFEARNQSLKLCTFTGVDTVSSSGPFTDTSPLHLHILTHSLSDPSWSPFLEPVPQQNRWAGRSRSQRDAVGINFKGTVASHCRSWIECTLFVACSLFSAVFSTGSNSCKNITLRWGYFPGSNPFNYGTLNSLFKILMHLHRLTHILPLLCPPGSTSREFPVQEKKSQLVTSTLFETASNSFDRRYSTKSLSWIC